MRRAARTRSSASTSPPARLKSQADLTGTSEPVARFRLSAEKRKQLFSWPTVIGARMLLLVDVEFFTRVIGGWGRGWANRSR